MATVNRFEDLEIWQSARQLSREVFKITLQENFIYEFKLKEQIKSSSGSVMDNIAEGFGRAGRIEFIQFLSIAKGSLDELKSQLYRILDNGLIADEKFKDIFKKADDLAAKIYSFMHYLNTSIHKGTKFKGRT